MTNLDGVLARIRRLERTVLGLILLALAALLIAGAGWRALWAERSPGPALDTIRARSVETGELVLRDKDGNVRARLQIAEPGQGGARLTLYELREEPVAHQGRMEVTSDGVHIFDAFGGEMEARAPAIFVSSANGATARFGVLGDLGATVTLKMQDAEVELAAMAPPSGEPPEFADMMPRSYVKVHNASWWSSLEAYRQHADVLGGRGCTA